MFKGRRILVAEDMEINREILKALLKATGVKITFAADGLAVVEEFKKDNSYDLIFMDVHMPGQDGYNATKAIRACESERAKTIPIVAMTACMFDEDKAQAEEAGMTGYLNKPINIEEVIEVMKEQVK
ncbi:MAG: response regulator [Suipraeoptans sp.]